MASGKIEEVRILGDFFLHPEETIMSIEGSLTGIERDESLIEAEISKASVDATFVGVTAADIAKAIVMAWDTE